ncbi:hypothetical protein [Flavobacterium filum]|uniref:hypothetical protein n=1 Tax=Flavobacterium filum TaxID=370974 RepID=UPI0004137339|nr:hypothetical protein [Flavobacterium filum]
MSKKQFNILLFITSFFGYLEWGKDNHSFIFEVEWEVIAKVFSNPLAIVHPFILLPLLGQMLIFITLFQSIPSKKLTYIGIACMSILFGMMTIVGLLSLKWTILLSTLPFWIIVVMIFRFKKQ